MCRYVTDIYDIAEESIQRSIDENTYGKRRTIEVTVVVWNDECEIDEMGQEKIFEAIFPQ